MLTAASPSRRQHVYHGNGTANLTPVNTVYNNTKSQDIPLDSNFHNSAVIYQANNGFIKTKHIPNHRYIVKSSIPFPLRC